MYQFTRNDKKIIKDLVIGECPNFDREYGCLPADKPCYMLNLSCRDGSVCKYFKNAVLPLSAEVKGILTGKRTASIVCGYCKKDFIPTKTNKVYCSELCKVAGQKRSAAERTRKSRQSSSKM